jgi:hypothetical protein
MILALSCDMLGTYGSYIFYFSQFDKQKMRINLGFSEGDLRRSLASAGSEGEFVSAIVGGIQLICGIYPLLKISCYSPLKG